MDGWCIKKNLFNLYLCRDQCVNIVFFMYGIVSLISNLYYQLFYFIFQQKKIVPKQFFFCSYLYSHLTLLYFKYQKISQLRTIKTYLYGVVEDRIVDPSLIEIIYVDPYIVAINIKNI